MSEEQKNEKVLKQKISIDIFINSLYAIVFMIYYLSLNILGKFMIEEKFFIYIKYSCMVFLGIGILAFESGYKKDKGKYWIHGIEFLVISFYTLMIKYVVRVNELDFEKYVTVSSIAIVIYYILKCMIIYTKERKVYLKSLSDIKEIVKKDEPIKKEATKKNKNSNIEENNKVKSKKETLKEDYKKTKANHKSSDKTKNKEKIKQESKKIEKKEESKKVGKKAKTKEENNNKEKNEIKENAPKKRGRPKKVTN